MQAHTHIRDKLNADSLDKVFLKPDNSSYQCTGTNTSLLDGTLIHAHLYMLNTACVCVGAGGWWCVCVCVCVCVEYHIKCTLC